MEVLITAAIIGIVTAIVIVRYGAFNNSVLLKSQAYEMALDLRETQVFAISVRGDTGGFREEYGMYFTSEDPNLPNRYRLFLDNGTADPPAYNVGEEIGDPYYIDSRFEVRQICLNGCSVDVTELSVSFGRPDFDAKFSAPGVVGSISDAQIELAPVGGSETRNVIINSVGQITVE